MKIPAPAGFSWTNYGAYDAFDRFLETFVLQRKSFITNHPGQIDLPKALRDIHERFVAGYLGIKKTFSGKAEQQFADAPKETRIVFANVEYLWAMPSSSMRPVTKREYALRWFEESEVVTGPRYYFNGDDGIANPGPAYQSNKYNELISLFRILSLLLAEADLSTLAEVKSRIGDICYEALYDDPEPHGGFSVLSFCGVHCALLHLSNPDKFQSIISKNNKGRIERVFEHIIADRPNLECPEKRLNLIRERLYGEHGADTDPGRKYRWFFYTTEIRDRWLSKEDAKQQTDSSIRDEIQREEDAEDLEEDEGERTTVLGHKVRRSAKLAAEAKVRDHFTCRACTFHFKRQIVHVHHLDPLSERKEPSKTHVDDLITLCPNCHFLAHYLLRQKRGGDAYKDRDRFLTRLKTFSS